MNSKPLARLFGPIRPARPDPLVKAGVAPGLYHYVHDCEGEITRYHLRIEASGSGVLVANAAAAALLQPSGSILAKGLLDGDDEARIIARIEAVFAGVTPARARTDLDEIRRLVAALDAPGDNYPILNLADPAFTSGRSRLEKPLSADIPLAEPSKIVPLLDRLWELGIPHATFIAGPKSNAQDLVRAVERAEDLGMIAGVRGRGSELARGSLVSELAQAGVDHINVLFLSATSDVHNALAGGADHQKTTVAIAQAHESEICPVAEVALVEATLATLGETIAELQRLEVRNVGFFAVVAEESLPAAGVLRPEEVLLAAERVEGLASESDVRFLWYPPLRFNPLRGLAEQVRRGPRCSGAEAVRIEPDGEVIPPTGPFRASGNLLRGTWPG